MGVISSLAYFTCHWWQRTRFQPSCSRSVLFLFALVYMGKVGLLIYDILFCYIIFFSPFRLHNPVAFLSGCVPRVWIGLVYFLILGYYRDSLGSTMYSLVSFFVLSSFLPWFSLPPLPPSVFIRHCLFSRSLCTHLLCNIPTAMTCSSHCCK